MVTEDVIVAANQWLRVMIQGRVRAEGSATLYNVAESEPVPPAPLQFATWAHLQFRFGQSVLRAAEAFAGVTDRGSRGELHDFEKDDELKTLGQALAEAFSTGAAIAQVGRSLQQDVQPLIEFLANPLSSLSATGNLIEVADVIATAATLADAPRPHGAGPKQSVVNENEQEEGGRYPGDVPSP